MYYPLTGETALIKWGYERLLNETFELVELSYSKPNDSLLGKYRML